MTASPTTAAAASTGTAKPGLLASIFKDIAGVVSTVINSSAISPSTKADLHTTLATVTTAAGTIEQQASTDVVDELQAAPEQAAAATGLAVSAAASKAGPAGVVVADVVAPVAEMSAEALMQKFISTFEAHNASMMTDLQNIANAAPKS